jgi:purine-binding chemotaxis protein CheW
MAYREKEVVAAVGSAHSLQEILDRRAESLAQEAAEEHIADVKVEDVREIYQEYVITTIPCVPDFVLGVVNIRGEIISVTDVARLMRLGALTTDLAVAPAIVIKNDECTTAIVVDEIGDIADVPRDGVEPPLSTIDKTQAEFIAGSLYVDHRLLGLINTDRVLEPVTAVSR